MMQEDKLTSWVEIMTKKNKLISKLDMANISKSNWKIDMTKKHNMKKDVAMSIEDAQRKNMASPQNKLKCSKN